MLHCLVHHSLSYMLRRALYITTFFAIVLSGSFTALYITAPNGYEFSADQAQTFGAVGPYKPVQGGTGISTTPSYGQVLVGDGSGIYTLMSTSSLGITGGGSWATTSSDYWLSQRSTTNLAEGTNLYFTTARATTSFIGNLAATTSISSITALPSLGTVSTSLTGILKATAGVLSAASAGTDYESPLSFTYPLQRAANAISLAFGTTTANSWSAHNIFSSIFATNASTTNATTSALAITGATSALLTTDATGRVVATSSLDETYGGTGQTTVASGDILYGSAANVWSRLAKSTDGFVLALSGGVPTWVATTTLSTISGTLSIAKGGTGSTTAPQGQLIYAGASAYQSVATTTASCSGSTSCSSFTIIGSSPVTITGTGGSGGGLASSSPWTAGTVTYVKDNATLAAVATTTLSLSGFPANIPATLGALVGGSNTTWTWWGLATTSQPASSNLLVSNGAAGVYGTATTTLQAGAGVSLSGTAVILGASPITITNTSGAFPFTTTSYSGTTVQASSTPFWLKATTPYSLIASSTYADVQYAANGSVSAPGFAFANATNRGLYNNGSGLCLVNAGVCVGTIDAAGFTISTTKQILGGDVSTGATPGLSFGGDSNTGLFSAAADNLGFTTGGSEKARFLANGFFGIATTAPYKMLSVAGDIVGATFEATTTGRNAFPYASSTAISANVLCLGASPDCRSTWPTGGSGGGLATTTPWTAGDLAQVVDNGTVKSIATSSLNLTTSAFASANISQWTNNSNFITLSSLSALAPLFYNSGTGAFSWYGLSTTTQPASSNVLTSDGTNGVYGTATTSLAVNSSITSSGTLGALLGGANTTLSLNMANANTWTALQTFANATSTLLSSSYASTTALYVGTGQGALYTGSGAKVSVVATSTPTVTAPITYSGTLGSFLGGSSGAFDCTTANASTKGCIAAADFSKFNSATTTFSWPLIYTLGTNAVTWGGLATSSALASGAAVVYSTGVNTVASVATTTFGATDSTLTVTGTAGYLVGGTNSSIKLNLANANTWTALQTFNYSSSTAYSSFATASSTSLFAGTLALPNIVSSLLKTDGSGNVTAFTGTSCTNQFVRSLNGSGVATCATVANTDLQNSSITINGSSVSLGGSITVASTTLLGDKNTWSALQAFGAASSTQFSISGWLGIPNASTPSLTANGSIAIRTTAASTSLTYYDGSAQRYVYPDGLGGLPFASSTLAYIGSYGAAGTTTIKQMRAYRPLALLAFYCDTDTGTAYVSIGNGSATTTAQCSASGTLTTSSVTWTMGQVVWIGIGTQSGSPNIITVSPDIRKD